MANAGSLHRHQLQLIVLSWIFVKHFSDITTKRTKLLHFRIRFALNLRTKQLLFFFFFWLLIDNETRREKFYLIIKPLCVIVFLFVFICLVFAGIFGGRFTRWCDWSGAREIRQNRCKCCSCCWIENINWNWMWIGTKKCQKCLH